MSELSIYILLLTVSLTLSSRILGRTGTIRITSLYGDYSHYLDVHTLPTPRVTDTHILLPSSPPGLYERGGGGAVEKSTLRTYIYSKTCTRLQYIMYPSLLLSARSVLPFPRALEWSAGGPFPSVPVGLPALLLGCRGPAAEVFFFQLSLSLPRALVFATTGFATRFWT